MVMLNGDAYVPFLLSDDEQPHQGRPHDRARVRDANRAGNEDRRIGALDAQHAPQSFRCA
jgi:hypothetical protein